MALESTALKNKIKDKRRSEASGKSPMFVYLGSFIFTTGGFMF